MLKKFYHSKLKPDYYAEDLRSFDWQQLKKHKIKIIFLDIDNTLAKHGSRKPDDYAIAVVQIIQDHGFDICILSNAMSERIEEFAGHLKVDFLENARKPSPKRLINKLQETNYNASEAILVGDQLFTDVWAGNNAGCMTVLVKQRFYDEAIQVKLKRKLEQWFINRFDK
ncbi:MAG: YqeG family HAD IIIA-type phosphatase [Clostridiaceae bacterium]|nr:YqeG family HAD IIIA-type phosphatase [Clostridiaceae bacterium]